MKRKRWLIVSIMGAVMALGIASGVVAAQEATGPDEDSTIRGLAARVAEILGIDETQVQDAIEQAKAEMHDERLDAHLAAMVDSGRLTQQQADEYRVWIESRPEGLSPKAFGGRGRHGRSGGHFRGRGFHGGGRGFFGGPQTVPTPEGTETTL